MRPCKEVKSTAKDVCLVEDNKQYLDCKWRERLVLLKVLVRVCKGDRENCCQTKYTDVYNDISLCMRSSTTHVEQMKQSNAIKEVLEQCSKRRYCIIENTAGSALTRLKTVDVGVGRIVAGLTVAYNCENVLDAPHVSVCDTVTKTSDFIYLDNSVLSRNEGNLSCICHIESETMSPINVHVLDMRLRRNSHLRLENDLGESRQYDAGTVIFGSVIRFNYFKLSLIFTKLGLADADDIWIKVNANTHTVKVTCQGPQAQQLARSPLETTEPSLEPFDDMSLTFLIIGFLSASVLIGLLVIVIIVCRRMVRRSHDCRGNHPGAIPGKTCEKHIYSQVEQTLASNQGSLSARSQDEIDCKSLDYTLPWDDKPVPKPRSRQDLTYISEPQRGSRHLSGCSGNIELVELKS